MSFPNSEAVSGQSAETAIHAVELADPWVQRLRWLRQRTLSARVNANADTPELPPDRASAISDALGIPCDAFRAFVAKLFTATSPVTISDLLQDMDAFGAFPGFAHFHDIDALRCYDFLVDSVRRGKAASENGCPVMPIVAYPKTGSAFVVEAMSRIMNVPAGVVSLCHLTAIRPWLSFAARFPMALHDHMLPSPTNVAMLANAGIEKVVIVNRDYRQALLSLAHQLAGRVIRTDASGRDRSMSFDDLLAQLVETQPTLHYEWLKQWVVEANRCGLHIAIVNYEDMVADGEGFFRRILEFFAAPPHVLARVEHCLSEANRLKTSGGGNFRKGSLDEWKEVLSAGQQRVMNEAAERFAEFASFELTTLGERGLSNHQARSS